MRWTATVLSVLVAAAQLTLFLVAQQQLQVTLDLVGQGPAASGLPGWLPWVWAVGWAAPWLVAPGLLATGRTRIGSVVAVTSAVLVATTGLGSAWGLVADRATTLPSAPATWVAELGGATVWVLALAAGLAAWSARPRGGWRVAAPGPDGWYVTFAVLAWLPAAFRTTQFAPPGAPRAFVETVAGTVAGIDAVASIAGAVVVGLLLFVAPRLRPDGGGALVLAYAVPTLLAEIGNIARVVGEDGLILTPSGVLGLAGLLGLVVMGSRWVSRRPDDEPSGTVPGRRQ